MVPSQRAMVTSRRGQAVRTRQKNTGYPFPKKSAIRLVVSSLYNILYSKFTGKAAGSLAPLELEQTGVESRSIQCESPALPARERRSLTRKRSFLHQRMGNGGRPT